MKVDGVIAAPPFRPSTPFPWGTDHIGRDVQALVLNGARQTLTIAFFGTLARILLGTILGLFAGWWAGGRFDQLVTGAIGVWAAFPITLFGVILIQGLGIQQGMWVFIVAICIVGWGEVAQVIRRQVMSLKPQPYMEAAWSVGARASRLLSQHALPHLVPLLLVLAALEMGSILMLLAELGFLNIFLGGGFRVQIGEAGRMQPVIAYFSDVPEWGAMLANIRDWWRSYPWMAWYPGVAVFLAILTFNLLGEGLRRFLDESRVNIGRLFNRHTAIGAGAAVLGLVLLLPSATPIGEYQSVARRFNPERALTDVRALSSPEFEGRETGTMGLKRSAEYIAQRMEESGLFPAGDLTPTKERNTFIQALPISRPHLTGIPRLEILGPDEQVIEALVYREDFVENPVNLPQRPATGPIIGVAIGADPGSPGKDPYLLGNKDLRDAVMIILDPGDKRINYTAAAGTLIVSDDPAVMQKKLLFAEKQTSQRDGPVMVITPTLADRLLTTAGSSLAELKDMQNRLNTGEVAVTGAGATVSLTIPLDGGFDQAPDEGYFNVIGYIPGTGAQMASQGGRGLDSQVIMVAAYFDGPGVGPDGTLYPGANDNASGVAAMLEMARVLKESPYQPKKTVVFVAWSGGERQEGLSVKNVMNAKLGFSSLSVESVIELSGLGAGGGKAVALEEGSSYRLTQLFQKAAGRLGVATTTRGRGPHFGAEAATGFGGRDALSLCVSWNGSDGNAHTPADTWETLDLEKLRKAGESTLLTLSVLSRETKY
jgi:ABC-type dipeptide/oligopeptide/nickel transport system permease subunit